MRSRRSLPAVRRQGARRGTMVDRIGHRGPDADGLLEMSTAGRRCSSRTGGCRSSTCRSGRPAVRQGRPHPQLQRRAYNYRELRDTLRGRGVRFRDRFRHRGRAGGLARSGAPAGLARFRGMFAFAIHDERTRPSPWPGTRSASSRCTSCRADAGSCSPPSSRLSSRPSDPSSRVDPAALVASTLYYFLPDEQCAIQRRPQAPAGIVGRVADGRVHPGRTLLGARRGSRWPPRPDRRRTWPRCIEESVAAHLVADVPVASFLSGGLDSSLITAMAAHHDPSIEAYTITFRPRRPASRGDARRRRLRPEDGSPPRDPAARDRDQPGRGRHAPPGRRHPRRADR